MNNSLCEYCIEVESSQDILIIGGELINYCSNLIKEYNYIWHHSSLSGSLSGGINLKVSSESNTRLIGSNNVLDCIDDEWLIVWLLFKLSSALAFTEYNLVISIQDEDGQFLLIESANYLPKLLNPNNSKNRVWIYKGQLHLIPLSFVSNNKEEDEDSIDRLSALNLIRDASIQTLANQQIENLIQQRISIYPQFIINNHLHKTITYLPNHIALALSIDHTLISHAIQAFYLRDPQSLLACNKMSRFPPTTPTLAFSHSTTTDSTLPSTVYIPTLLTRPLYSQLVLQRFFPPKVFEKVGWMDGVKMGGEEERRRSVGMKIACGFEMLYTTTSPILRFSTEFDPTNSSYQSFIASLTRQGYFEQEIIGSSKYVEKELIARTGWIASKEEDTKKPSFAQRVDEAIALAQSRPLSAQLTNRITTPLSPTAVAALESSEDWLTLDEDRFEAMLKSRGPKEDGMDEELEGFGEGEGYSDEDNDNDNDIDNDNDEDAMEGVEGESSKEEKRATKRAAKRLEKMAKKVEDFVQGRGALDGAQFEDELSDDEEDDSEDEEIFAPLTAEERAIRLASLVAPLPDNTWGSDTVVSTGPPPLDSELPPPSSASVNQRPRSPQLTSEKYDGASDSDSSIELDESEIRKSATTNDEGNMVEDEEDEDGPAIVDEEVDMGLEMDEFLKFATETLGLTEEQYSKILGERKQRGAFVPPPSAPKKSKPDVGVTYTTPTPSLPPKSTASASNLPRPILKNPNLTSFDALMEQMDSELAKITPTSSLPSTPSTSSSSTTVPPKSKPKSKPKLNPRPPASKITRDPDSSDSEIDSDNEGMEAELAELFKSVSGEDAMKGEGGTMDYNIVKNFLESFQSQGGFAGPAGNMAGRLGFPLPKNFEK